MMKQELHKNKYRRKQGDKAEEIKEQREQERKLRARKSNDKITTRGKGDVIMSQDITMVVKA